MPTIAISLPQPAVKAGKFELLPDGERTKLERRAERALADALTAWGNALLRGITAGNVQAVLARLDNPTWAGNIAMRDALIAVLQQAADVGVEYGRQQIESVVYGVKFTVPSLSDIDWELANADAAKWATDYGYQLIRGIQDATRRIVANEIVYFVDNSLTINQLRDRIVSATGGAFSKARARRIAVTETTRAYAEGNMAAWDRSGVVEGKEWYTAVDELVCPLCAPMHGQVVPIKGTFSDGSNGPPRHVNCRCNVLPVAMGDTGENLTSWRPVLDDGGRVLDWVEGGGGQVAAAAQPFAIPQNQQTLDAILKNADPVLSELSDDIIKYLNENGNVAIQIDAANLEKVLAEGQFKNQFETGSSGGVLNNNMRAKAEKMMFGIDEAAAGSSRPIYGYVDAKWASSDVDVYGDVKVLLRPSTKARTTVSFGDSLYAGIDEKLVPSPLTAPHYGAANSAGWQIKIVANRGGSLIESMADLRLGYYEAQIHGGVSVDDIERVVFRRLKYVDQGLLDTLDRLGIGYGE